MISGWAPDSDPDLDYLREVPVLHTRWKHTTSQLCASWLGCYWGISFIVRETGKFGISVVATNEEGS